MIVWGQDVKSGRCPRDASLLFQNVPLLPLAEGGVS